MYRFPQPALLRITLDLIAAELARSRRRSVVELGRGGWSEATRVDDEGLGLDSLERLDVASAVSEFFHLHEYGAEDYLLALPTIGAWCDIIAQSLAATGTWITFRTSGSTGEPKRCTHALADLVEEARGWAEEFAGTPHLVAMVPAHHIYGTIFTAILPDMLGSACTVVDQAGSHAVNAAPPGSLIVATPTYWAYLARALVGFPERLVGVTSTAPMPDHLAERLRGQRLSRLVEVYGSSETAGLAMRDDPRAAYTLLPRWHDAPTMPDNVRFLDDRRFVLEGRRDGAVQIGGTNVFPARVRDALLAHAGVAEAAVRLDVATGRLKAFVVPVAEDAGLVDELDRWCGTQLSSVERPRQFATGGHLPINAMGKLADW